MLKSKGEKSYLDIKRNGEHKKFEIDKDSYEKPSNAGFYVIATVLQKIGYTPILVDNEIRLEYKKNAQPAPVNRGRIVLKNLATDLDGILDNEWIQYTTPRIIQAANSSDGINMRTREYNLSANGLNATSYDEAEAEFVKRFPEAFPVRAKWETHGDGHFVDYAVIGGREYSTGQPFIIEIGKLPFVHKDKTMFMKKLWRKLPRLNGPKPIFEA